MTSQEPKTPSTKQTWLLIIVYFCLCWFVLAVVVFFGVIDNVDLVSPVKKPNQPYDIMLDVSILSAMIVVPFGYLLGMIGFFTKPSERRILFVFPTLVLSLILIYFVAWQYRMKIPTSGASPVVVEIETPQN